MSLLLLVITPSSSMELKQILSTAAQSRECSLPGYYVCPRLLHLYGPDFGIL